MARLSIYKPSGRRHWVLAWTPLRPELDAKGRPKVKRWTAKAATEAQSHALAERCKAEVAEARRKGVEWRPPRDTKPAKEGEPTVAEVLMSWLSMHKRKHERAVKQGRDPATLRTYRNQSRLLVRFLRDERGLLPATTPASSITQRLLEDYYDWLLRPGTSQVKRGPRSPSTAYKAVEVAVRPFRWAASADEYRGRVFALTMPDELARPPRTRTLAPRFSEAGAAVAAARGYLRRAMALAYFTGLRINLQIMRLRWGDFDLDDGRLHVRGVLGKSAQEQVGRRVPISPHLAAELARWADEDRLGEPGGATEDDFVVRAPGRKHRTIRGRDTERAWIRAGTWNAEFGQPTHCFRKCLIEGLELLGARPAAVDHLVGHEVGTTTKRAYRNPDVTLREAMEEAVALIPPLPTGE